jgi:hypothetical protein
MASKERLPICNRKMESKGRPRINVSRGWWTNAAAGLTHQIIVVYRNVPVTPGFRRIHRRYRSRPKHYRYGQYQL